MTHPDSPTPVETLRRAAAVAHQVDANYGRIYQAVALALRTTTPDDDLHHRLHLYREVCDLIAFTLGDETATPAEAALFLTRLANRHDQ